MSQKRLTTWQKATALVPLALLSGAWTTSLAVTSTASADSPDGTTLPDGRTVPDQALEAPASMSRPGSIAPGIPAGASAGLIADTSTNGIPAAALAAYQRAEQVINSADTSCNLSWQLVAAIGRVESDHGRFGGSVLGDDGKSRPGIFGIPLDGSDGTAEIRDTDAGQFDNDQVFDRAVGPMQFIPQTWSVVGVDADGDGARDPQDIDDAALATAVYLCSGDEDLATDGGRRAAVYRYNHSREYVDLVLSVMNAYLEGDYSSVPNGVALSPVFAPSTSSDVPAAGSTKRRTPRSTAPAGSGGGSTSRGGTSTNDGGDVSTTPDAPQEQSGQEPAKSLTDTTKDTVDDTTKKVDDTVDSTTKPVDGGTGGTLTEAEATTQCLESGISALDTAALDACVKDLMG